MLCMLHFDQISPLKTNLFLNRLQNFQNYFVSEKTFKDFERKLMYFGEKIKPFGFQKSTTWYGSVVTNFTLNHKHFKSELKDERGHQVSFIKTHASSRERMMHFSPWSEAIDSYGNEELG